MAFGNQITQIRLPDGKVINLVDWTDKPLWSLIELFDSFTDQEINAFTYIISDQVSVSQNAPNALRRAATDRDTNLSTPAAMASTEEMLVYGVKVEAFQLNYESSPPSLDEAAPGLPIPEAQNLAILNHACLLRLTVSQKVYVEAGLGYFNAGFGPFVAGGIGTRTYANPGLPSASAARALVVPTHIGGQEKYRVTLVNPNGNPVLFRDVTGAHDPTVVMRLRILLEGLYKRPVS